MQPPMGPLMENDGAYLHGRTDPGVDENISLVESVPLDPGHSRRGNRSLSPDDENHTATTQNTSHATPSDECLFLALPFEIISQIVAFLSPLDLASLSQTCKQLELHAKADIHWHRHVQDNVPGVRVTSPYPCRTYRELYVAHDPRWFLPKHRVWFSDQLLTGKLLIVRFDPRWGCIRGYQLVVERPPPSFNHWEVDDEVVIHSFNPTVRLHLEQPVLQLDALSLESAMASLGSTAPQHRFSTETPMRFNSQNLHGIFSNLLLTRPVDERPNMELWPPLTIPSRHRVLNASREDFVGHGHKPQKRSQISNLTFGIRRWMEISSSRHFNEEVHIYATLDPKLYTPTADKPYRGIFVGDYSGHGCEFLLINQPDDEETFAESSVVRLQYETDEEWEKRKRDERIYRGSLEGIKLTGDANVQRGEYTFIADDLQGGFIRNGTEERFKGARIVKSRGHIADRFFRHDKYIQSQLIMISPDRLAQYWIDFGHISFFQRVDIDQLLLPLSDS